MEKFRKLYLATLSRIHNKIEKSKFIESVRRVINQVKTFKMMMGGMGGPLASMLDNKLQTDNKLTISWVDSSWVPILNTNNVMDYFSDRRNPFYDASCNNENLKMQRLSLDQLANMTGIEYCLLYVQEPILYVIRKQQRMSPTQTNPISDYYIVAGTIYQAPDLCSVVNSRLLSAISHIQSAFEEARSYVKYHPAKGYRWDFQPNNSNTPYGAKKLPPGAPGGDSKSITGDEIKSEKGVPPESIIKTEKVDPVEPRGIKRERGEAPSTMKPTDQTKKMKFT